MEKEDILIVRQQIGKALDIFSDCFRHFIINSLKNKYGLNWERAALYGPSMDDSMVEEGNTHKRKVRTLESGDMNRLFHIFLSHWESVFNGYDISGHLRTIVHEIKNTRNQWAHQYGFSMREGYRALDTISTFFLKFGEVQAEIEHIRTQLLMMLAKHELGEVEGVGGIGGERNGLKKHWGGEKEEVKDIVGTVDIVDTLDIVDTFDILDVVDEDMGGMGNNQVTSLDTANVHPMFQTHSSTYKATVGFDLSAFQQFKNN